MSNCTKHLENCTKPLKICTKPLKFAQNPSKITHNHQSFVQNFNKNNFKINKEQKYSKLNLKKIKFTKIQNLFLVFKQEIITFKRNYH